MSYLRYLCLFAHSGVQHILCCVFVLFVFVLCTLGVYICQFIPDSRACSSYQGLVEFEFEFGCLTPLSEIFQLYHGDQF